MANIKSVQKDIRRTEKRTTYNKRLRNRVKDAQKALKKDMELGNKETAVKRLSHLQKVADKATKKGVIKKGNADRRKSRLAKKINKLTAANVAAN